VNMLDAMATVFESSACYHSSYYIIQEKV